MNSWIFFISAFGFLMAQEHYGRLQLFSSKNRVKEIGLQWAHLLLQVLTLIVLYRLLLEIWLPKIYVTEGAILFLLIAAYALGILMRNSRNFYLITFAIACFSVLEGSDSMWLRLCLGLYLTIGVLLFEILLLGCVEKAKFSNFSKSLSNIPLQLFIATILSLALWGIQGINST